MSVYTGRRQEENLVVPVFAENDYSSRRAAQLPLTSIDQTYEWTYGESDDINIYTQSGIQKYLYLNE